MQDLSMARGSTCFKECSPRRLIPMAVTSLNVWHTTLILGSDNVDMTFQIYSPKFLAQEFNVAQKEFMQNIVFSENNNSTEKGESL